MGVLAFRGFGLSRLLEVCGFGLDLISGKGCLSFDIAA